MVNSVLLLEARVLGRGGPPCGFDAGDANLRRYVRNSATNATDPTGLFADPTSQPAAPPSEAKTLTYAEAIDFLKKLPPDQQAALVSKVKNLPPEEVLREIQAAYQQMQTQGGNQQPAPAAQPKAERKLTVIEQMLNASDADIVKLNDTHHTFGQDNQAAVRYVHAIRNYTDNLPASGSPTGVIKTKDGYRIADDKVARQLLEWEANPAYPVGFLFPVKPPERPPADPPKKYVDPGVARFHALQAQALGLFYQGHYSPDNLSETHRMLGGYYYWTLISLGENPQTKEKLVAEVISVKDTDRDRPELDADGRTRYPTYLRPVAVHLRLGSETPDQIYNLAKQAKDNNDYKQFLDDTLAVGEYVPVVKTAIKATDIIETVRKGKRVTVWQVGDTLFSFVDDVLTVSGPLMKSAEFAAKGIRIVTIGRKATKGAEAGLAASKATATAVDTALAGYIEKEGGEKALAEFVEKEGGTFLKEGKAATKTVANTAEDAKEVLDANFALAARGYRSGRNATAAEINKYVGWMEKSLDEERKVKVVFLEQAEGLDKARAAKILEEGGAGDAATITEGRTAYDPTTKTVYVVFRDKNSVKAAALFEENLHITQIRTGVATKSAEVTLPGGRALILKGGSEAQEMDVAVKMWKAWKEGNPMVGPKDVEEKIGALANHYLKDHNLNRTLVEDLLQKLVKEGWTLKR